MSPFCRRMNFLLSMKSIVLFSQLTKNSFSFLNDKCLSFRSLHQFINKAYLPDTTRDRSLRFSLTDDVKTYSGGTNAVLSPTSIQYPSTWQNDAGFPGQAIGWDIKLLTLFKWPKILTRIIASTTGCDDLSNCVRKLKQKPFVMKI